MFFADLLALLYPPRCVGCNEAGVLLCASCSPGASFVRRAGVLGRPVVALGPYAGALRSAVLAFKRGRRDVGALLAALAAGAVLDELAAASRCELGSLTLVPVPTTAGRRAGRGFDQALFLAERVGELRGLGVLAVLRQRAGDAQRGRSRTDRLRAEGRFALAGRPPIADARLLLVDDVMTTGATLRDCVRTLERAGAQVAGALVLARAESRGAPRVSCDIGGSER